MDYPKNTIKSVDVKSNERKRCKHLQYAGYVAIGLRLKDGWSAYRIAKDELHCAPNTVRNIIKKGMAPKYNGKVMRYDAEVAWAKHCENRSRCRKSYAAMDKAPFLCYVNQHVRENGWSLDACCGRALLNGEFKRSDIVCTKTLYNYTDLGLLEIKNIDLPQKLSRKPQKVRERKNKRILGRSIEERPESVEDRKEFGHWETDLVIGQNTKMDEVILTLIERKTRNLIVFKLPDKSADSVLKVFLSIQQELGTHFSQVFKTITTDNGSEFSRLSELEALSQTLVYFAHPYTACEKGTIENHNGLLRRFIHKGKRISDYSLDAVFKVELWANGLPRKRLGYHTPEELFEEEMDSLYAA